MKNHLTDRTDLGYTICIVNRKEEQFMTEYTLQLSREQMENLLTILDGRYDVTGLKDEMDTDHFEFVVSLIYKEILHKLG